MHQFDDLTPKEFDEALKAWYKLKNMEFESQMKLQHTIARFIAVQIWNSAGKTLKSDIKKPEDVFPFPWETQEATKVQSTDDMKLQLQLIAQSFANNKTIKSRKELINEPRGTRRP